VSFVQLFYAGLELSDGFLLLFDEFLGLGEFGLLVE
jgi:hypothetical protein